MKKQLQRLLLIAAIMAAPWATRGQTLSSYTLTVDTTTFNSITSTGTALSFSTLDDGSATTTLPFAFGYGENVFPAGTSIALSANGFIRLCDYSHYIILTFHQCPQGLHRKLWRTHKYNS